jgi:hypothetical protein
MKSEVLTAVKMPMFIVWFVTRVELWVETNVPEDGGSMFLRNVGFYLRVHSML